MTYKGQEIEKTKNGYEVTEPNAIFGGITTIFDTEDEAKEYIDKHSE
ncbi:MAG TPA: hypothetical protein VLA13_10020 [Massilibacterium sp.]|nr:hypothetical protein [Massilibacterium sp.]